MSKICFFLFLFLISVSVLPHIPAKSSKGLSTGMRLEFRNSRKKASVVGRLGEGKRRRR